MNEYYSTDMFLDELEEIRQLQYSKGEQERQLKLHKGVIEQNKQLNDSKNNY